MLILSNQPKSKVWSEVAGIVWKQYLDTGSVITAKQLFENEIGALSLLKGAPGVPHLLTLDRDELKFSMKFAGDKMKRASEVRDPQYWRERIYDTLTTMGIKHNNIQLHDMLISQGRPTLIDFELATYEGSPMEGMVIEGNDNKALREVLGL